VFASLCGRAREAIVDLDDDNVDGSGVDDGSGVEPNESGDGLSWMSALMALWACDEREDLTRSFWQGRRHACRADQDCSLASHRQASVRGGDVLGQ